MTGLMLKSLPIPPGRKAGLAGAFRRNQPRVVRRILRQYLRHLSQQDKPAARLCDAGVPARIAHAEKGDGGLTDDERRSLEACPHTTALTMPGTSYLLPVEKPQEVADIIAVAAAAAA